MRGIACLFLAGLPLAVHAAPKIGYAHATGYYKRAIHPTSRPEGWCSKGICPRS